VVDAVDFVEADVFVVLECSSVYSAAGDVLCACYTVDDCLEFIHRLPVKPGHMDTALVETHCEPTDWQKTTFEKRVGTDLVLRIERRWVYDETRPTQTTKGVDVFLIIKLRLMDLTSGVG
jgi:hypothetical protein